MTKKLLLTFALAGLSIAGAKTYTVNIPEHFMLASTQLQPGDYRVAVEGSRAVFKNDDDQVVAEANVKVENSTKKFEYTSIESKKVGDFNRIEEIRLGGTRTQLDFK